MERVDQINLKIRTILKAKDIINLLKPEGIDVSRSLKNSKNVISSKKLKNFLKQVTVV